MVKTSFAKQKKLHTGDVCFGVLDHNSVLNVNTTNFSQRSGRGVVVGDELSNNGDL
jgi:hypothetical protein